MDLWIETAKKEGRKIPKPAGKEILKLSLESEKKIKDLLMILRADTKKDAQKILGKWYRERKQHDIKLQKEIEKLWKKRAKLFRFYDDNRMPKTNNSAEHFFSDFCNIKKLCRSYKTVKGLENILFGKATKWNFEKRYESNDGKTPNERSGIVTKRNIYDYIGYPC